MKASFRLILATLAATASVRLVTDVSAAPFFGIEWEDIVSGTYISVAVSVCR